MVYGRIYVCGLGTRVPLYIQRCEVDRQGMKYKNCESFKLQFKMPRGFMQYNGTKITAHCRRDVGQKLGCSFTS